MLSCFAPLLKTRLVGASRHKKLTGFVWTTALEILNEILCWYSPFYQNVAKHIQASTTEIWAHANSSAYSQNDVFLQTEIINISVSFRFSSYDPAEFTEAQFQQREIAKDSQACQCCTSSSITPPSSSTFSNDGGNPHLIKPSVMVTFDNFDNKNSFLIPRDCHKDLNYNPHHSPTKRRIAIQIASLQSLVYDFEDIRNFCVKELLDIALIPDTSFSLLY